MSTSNVQQTSGNASAALASIAGSQSKSGAADSADQFLTLLLTQLRNQDPLNPMDNAQVTSQLAQINTVKGISQLNENFTKLMSSYSDSMNIQSAAMIGKNVLTEGSGLQLAATGGAYAGVELADAASVVDVVIKDSSGKEVARESLGAQKAGVIDFTWDGVGSAGQTLPAGKYTFSVEATNAGKKVTATALEAGTVSAMVKNGTGFQLDISGKKLVDFSKVKLVF